MIDTNYFWIITIALGLGTFFIRFSIIGLSSRFPVSENLRSIFAMIPVAIIPALIAPMVFFHKGHVDYLFGKERFFILILSSFVFFFTKSMLACISFGLVLLYLISNL